MKHLILIAVLLLSIPEVTLAQTDYGFGEGVIYKKNGDTLNCYVELAVNYDTKVAYKIEEKGREAFIKSSEIKSIKTPYKYVENILVDKKERLMAMQVDGTVKLFTHVTVNPGSSKQGYGGTYSMNHAPTIIYALKKNDIIYKVQKKNFKEVLSTIMGDQPSIIDVLNNNDLKFEDLEEIVTAYNKLDFILRSQKKITARILDAETRKPVKDAKVSIEGRSVETMTNAHGYFQLDVLGNDTLLISRFDYKSSQINIPEAASFVILLDKDTEIKE